MSNWRKDNQHKWDEYTRARKYGMFPGQYEEMYGSQRGLCAICLEPHVKLSIDHCHKTGKVRGLLCKKCNLVLGMVNDSEEILLSAMNYLVETRDNTEAGT